MIIEIINKYDLDDIELCGSKSLPIFYSQSDLKFLLYDKNYIIYKAVIDNKFCGFFVGQISDNRLHIMSFAVNPEFRRLKVGTNLINKIKDIYKNYYITLNVQQTNKDAINFYLKNNFVHIGELKNYYSNLENKDAFQMVFMKGLSDGIL